jgi:hypothetical protein
MAERNMYGCTPCPQCGSKYRWPTQSVHPKYPDSILCDDCLLVEPIDLNKEPEEEWHVNAREGEE